MTLTLLSHQWIELEKKRTISKATEDMHNIISHFDLIYIYRMIYPKMAEYTFFSDLHGIVTRRDHILGYKRSLNNFFLKKTKPEIIWSMFSDHKRIKLEYHFRAHRTTLKFVIHRGRVNSRLYSWLRFTTV